MNKKLLTCCILVLSCLVAAALAGVGTPIFITSGRIDESTVPIIQYKDLFQPGIPEFYCVDDAGSGVVGYRGSFRIEPHTWSNKPVREGSIPTAEDRLLNPDKPINITAIGCGNYNELSLNLDFYQDNGYGRLSMRVIDSKGNSLASVNSKENPYNKPAVIAVHKSQEPEVFYLEISDPTDKGDRYCYIVVNVKVYDATSRMHPKEVEAYTALNKYKQKYAQERNITDMGKFSIEDFRVIFDQINQELGYFAFDISKMEKQDEDTKEQTKQEAKKSQKSKKSSKSTDTKKNKRSSK